MPDDEIEPMKIDRPLDPFRGLPSAHAVGFAVLGDPGDHLHRPVNRCNEVDLQDLPEVLESDRSRPCRSACPP